MTGQYHGFSNLQVLGDQPGDYIEYTEELAPVVAHCLVEIKNRITRTVTGGGGKMAAQAIKILARTVGLLQITSVYLYPLDSYSSHQLHKQSANLMCKLVQTTTNQLWLSGI